MPVKWITSHNTLDLQVNIQSTLNTLGQRINRWYPNINKGGCCVFASILGHELQRRSIWVQVVVGTFDGTGNVTRARQRVKNFNNVAEWNNAGIYFNHVGLKIRLGHRMFYYDTNGLVSAGKHLGIWRIIPGALTVEEAELAAQHADAWNDTFDRRKIPSLRRHIRQFLDSNLPLTAAS